ncbi:GntR family transcriptional regulator [Cellulophaga sp. BC115SP]|uniref:GntR family transcriptional regulator n=1 Tax=Cellulophaga sp. BC115SP TaxID=2683263 RepID=UPI0014128BF2|nr:GntR family transcriptional regulator [Cellulophaga sp. BC115SP]NBB31383.1 UTRA domain-containing protein [Cellulophaga sp. BC115SP]
MTLKIDHNSKLPLHVQVENLMRELISSPTYSNGTTFLPKEIELANTLGVSRSTIRQATNKLEYEGLLKRKKGVGTSVAVKKKLSTGLDHWYSFTNEMKEKGIDVFNISLNVELVPANETIAAFFNIEVGRKIVKLSKLKGTKEEPIVYFESYFHPRIGVSLKDDFEIPLYTMLEDKYKIKVVRSNENISARLAGRYANRLGVQASEAILVRERFVYDPGDRPIEYNIGYYRSDKFVYSIDIKSNQ